MLEQAIDFRTDPQASTDRLTLARCGDDIHFMSMQHVSVDEAIRQLRGNHFICQDVRVDGLPTGFYVQEVCGEEALCYIPDPDKRSELLTSFPLRRILSNCSGVFVFERHPQRNP